MTEFGYTGNPDPGIPIPIAPDCFNLPDSNTPPLRSKVETEGSLDGSNQAVSIGHTSFNIGCLKTLTTLKISATGVTDTAIFGKSMIILCLLI